MKSAFDPEHAYVRLVADLPRPTPEQCNNFVEFVANAHSWYKHLPSLPPGVSFTFFLNPDSGRTRIRTRSGEVGYVDCVDGDDTRFHYTWMPTADYRRRFGHWDYYCANAPTFLILGQTTTAECESSPHVLTESGEWTSLPNEMLLVATCKVTALVHPYQHPRAHLRRFAGYDQVYENYARANPNDAEACRYRRLSDALNAAAASGEHEERMKELTTAIQFLHQQERPVLLSRIRHAMDRLLFQLFE